MPFSKRTKIFLSIPTALLAIIALVIIVSLLAPTHHTVDPDYRPTWPESLFWTPPDPAAVLPTPITPRLDASYALAGSRRNPQDVLDPASRSKNHPIPVPFHVKPDGPLSLVVTDEPAIFRGQSKGVRFYLINNAPAEQTFDSPDSLAIHQEAFDPISGLWLKIESEIPSNACLFGRRKIYLPAQHAWRLTGPRYQGPLSTQARFVFIYQDSENRRLYLFSNPYAAQIDPAQFTSNARDFPMILNPSYLPGFYPAVESGPFTGHVHINHRPIDIPASLNAPADQITLRVIPEPVVHLNKYQGLQVYLINNRSAPLDVATFGAPFIRQQALHADGQWKYVEARWFIDSGNSIKKAVLPPHQAFALTGSRYHGPIKTKLRFVVDLSFFADEPTFIYSNEFDGSVCPNQFEPDEKSK